MNVIFEGKRTKNGCTVSANKMPLSAYLTEVSHSPDGFEWGYGGSGPAQLAYAILRKCFGKGYAVRNHQNFKWNYVALLVDKDANHLDSFEIDAVAVAQIMGLFMPVWVECTGDAHKNPFIDHCGVCSPFWERIPTCKSCGKTLEKFGEKLDCIVMSG